MMQAIATTWGEPHLDTHGLQVHGVLHLAHAPGSCQKGLGGHAAAVDACASNVVSLNDCHLQPLHSGQGRAELTYISDQGFKLGAEAHR
jgi:hypothetical protein